MSAGRIDLWWFRFGGRAESARAALGLLDPAERKRFRQFDCAGAAHFFAFRRAARRVVLAGYLGARPERLQLVEQPGGKPVLAHPSTDLRFNASDSQTTGVIAVACGLPIGVDIEQVRAVCATRLADRILSPAERAVWQETPSPGRADPMLRTWTAKEALVKGMGLGLDLAAFRQITLGRADEPDAWRRAALGQGLAGQGTWHVCTMALAAARGQAAVVSIAAPSPHPVDVIDARDLLSRHGLA